MSIMSRIKNFFKMKFNKSIALPENSGLNNIANINAKNENINAIENNKSKKSVYNYMNDEEEIKKLLEIEEELDLVIKDKSQQLNTLLNKVEGIKA